jgi:hypothetical protein
MRNWSPKTRNYWGQKRRRDSTSTDQEENDASSTRPPMPWEPQDTTQDTAQDNTMYWNGENSDEEYYGNTPAIETTVITADSPSPTWEKDTSLIDQLKGKPPEDIDPQNFVNKILQRMFGQDNRSNPSGVSGTPPITGTDITGSVISAESMDGRGGIPDYSQHGIIFNNTIKVLGNVITGPVMNSDAKNNKSGINKLSDKQKRIVLDSPVDNAEVSSEYGKDRKLFGKIDKHGGTDYSVPVGTPIFATATGIAIRADYSSSFGNVIIIDHGPAKNTTGNVYTLYAHGNKLLKSVGNRVKINELIMLSGNSGNRTKGPHLHYEVIVYDKKPLTSDFYDIKNGSAIRFNPSELIKLLN